MTNNTKENIVWKTFANKNHAKYSIIRFGNCDLIEFINETHNISIDNLTRYRTVSLSTVSESFTRAKAEFKKTREFYFKIRPLNNLDKISKLFGKSKFKLLNKNYIYITNALISSDIFISNSKIQDILDKYQNLQIELYNNINIWNEDIREGITQLSITIDEISKSEIELNDLFILIKEFISSLHKHGMIR